MEEKTLDRVVAGYIVSNYKVLLVNHKELDKWLPFGGHIEENETPDDALRREAKEELGIEIEFLQYPESRKGNKREYALPFYVDVHPIEENHLHYCLFYLCKMKSRTISPNLEEINAYGWFSRENLEGSLVSKPVREACLQAIRTIRIMRTL